MKWPLMSIDFRQKLRITFSSKMLTVQKVKVVGKYWLEGFDVLWRRRCPHVVADLAEIGIAFEKTSGEAK